MNLTVIDETFLALILPPILVIEHPKMTMVVFGSIEVVLFFVNKAFITIALWSNFVERVVER